MLLLLDPRRPSYYGNECDNAQSTHTHIVCVQYTHAPAILGTHEAPERCKSERADTRTHVELCAADPDSDSHEGGFMLRVFESTHTTACGRFREGGRKKKGGGNFSIISVCVYRAMPD